MIRQAIVTKYLGPTNTRGTRIRVKAYAKSIIVNWDYELDVVPNHEKAAMILMKQLGWNSFDKLVGGSMPDGNYCWVQVEKKKVSKK